jgi:diacylglycerol kinase family enzyme
MRATAVSRGAQLAILNQLPTGAHVGNPHLLYKRVRRCKLTFLEGPGIFNVDGEGVRHGGTVELVCHRRMLPILTKRNCLAHSI